MRKFNANRFNEQQVDQWGIPDVSMEVERVWSAFLVPESSSFVRESKRYDKLRGSPGGFPHNFSPLARHRLTRVAATSCLHIDFHNMNFLSNGNCDHLSLMLTLKMGLLRARQYGKGNIGTESEKAVLGFSSSCIQSFSRLCIVQESANSTAVIGA